MAKENHITLKKQIFPSVVEVFLGFYDYFAVCVAYFLALWFRFDCMYSEIPLEYLATYLMSISFYGIFCIIIFWVCNLYKSIWRFASIQELIRVTMACVFTSTVYTLVINIFIKRMPLSYYLFGFLIQYCLIVLVRFSYRFILLERKKDSMRKMYSDGRVMIIGAGAAGFQFVKDILQSEKVPEKVCCIIDDNPKKWSKYIYNVPIVGGRDDILKNAEKYGINKIYLAIPSISAEDKRDILNICKETGCELKTLPGLYQLATGEVKVGDLKNVAIEDLLGREQIRTNMNEICSYIEGQTILVTGGGGSIGSELCRQVAKHNPKRLIIFDVYENNVYDIQLELKKKYPWLKLEVLIGSVRDSRRMLQVFETYKPDVVFHAAAHKHVPLMEDSPCEAIKNNAIGTYKTAYAAMVNGCKKFVLISTDKAVNPTNVMGASKRICEMIVQTFDRMIKSGRALEIPKIMGHGEGEINVNIPDNVSTEYVAVRFGNVLGSNGSVIPIFKRQIEAGGPVTVTHPDIIRYFMTIPEAVSLVMQSGAYAKGGEIFVLDMGEPVKIDTMARNLIKLSGLVPDEDIKIEYTGLRPGEKLYEEKLMDEEDMGTTANKRIHIGKPLEFDEKEIIDKVIYIMWKAYENDENIREYISDLVPTYIVK